MNKQDIEKALEETDGNLKKAAEWLGVKYPTFYWNVKKHNIKFKNQKEKIDDTKIVELYNKHQSLSLVAKELGCTSEGVRLVMKRHGIAVNKPVRYSFNERFFSTDTEEVFYWAGFIAADGCLKKQSNSDLLSIGLAAKDLCQLEQFKKDISSTHPIYHGIIKNSKINPNWNDTEKVEMTLISKHLPGDLERFNIVPRKSLTYKFPEWLLSHEFLHHFMRGYFDGDGSWFIGASKITPQVFFALRGTTEFLGVFRSVLEKNGLPERNKDIRVNSGIGVLEYGGNGHATKIRDFLYKDATVFLKRKYDIVKDIITVQRIETTPEELLELMERLGDQKKMADALGCSKPNVSRLIKGFGLRDQIKAAKSRYI